MGGEEGSKGWGRGGDEIGASAGVGSVGGAGCGWSFSAEDGPFAEMGRRMVDGGDVETRGCGFAAGVLLFLLDCGGVVGG